MFKSILVPVDGSVRAEAILPYVKDIATKYAARVVLLRVVEYSSAQVTQAGHKLVDRDTDPLVQGSTLANEYMEEARNYFKGLGTHVRTRIEYGPVYESIKFAAEKEQADLIAIASHGRSAFGQLISGSVASQLLHGLDIPLLVIRSDE